MRRQSSDTRRAGRKFRSRRAYRRWLKRQSGAEANRVVVCDLRSGMEALEQRVLLSATPVFELSSLLAVNGGDGSQGVVVNGVSLGDRAGVSVGSAGDINGDGFEDVIIGAFRDAPNGADSGASFVVFGQAGGFNASLQLSSLTGANGFKINGIAGGDFSGRSVAGAGDVNGDGFDDVLIGAFVASPNGAESGQAYVVYGQGGGFASTLELSALNGANGFTIDGLSAGDRLGFSVRGAGDVNGDGLDDFILGASLDAPNGAASGRAYVVFGQTGGFGPSLDLSTLNGTNGFAINGVSADDQLGISVNAAGDVNGDGIGDVVVGAFQDDPNANADSGSAFVVFGATGGFAASLDPSALNGTNGFTINGEASLDNAGRSVSSAGDFNGDGFGDVLIGAPAAAGSVAGSGSAYVVFGHAGVFASTLNLSALTGADGFKLNGIDAGDRAGLAVSAAGDTNGDGLDDLLVAADRANPNGTRSGETYLVLGRSSAAPASLNLSALSGTDGFVLNGIDTQDSSGTSIRAAGDVDGDGFGDFIIGAFLADPNGGESGESYLVFGGDFSNAVTHLGSALADGLVGTGGADVIVAGRGDDVVTANGGADVVLGGQGDDEVTIGDTTFKRIDGGRGADTLKLGGAGLTLDLTSIADTRLTGIETIDITGGPNTLTLDAREVLNISGTSNTLNVVRDITGTINFGAGWTQTNTQVVNGNQVTTFTQGHATLVITVLADILDPVVTVDPLVTASRSPQLTGTVSDLDPVVTVDVTVNGVTYPATVNGNGTWTLPAGTIAPDLADGIYEVQAAGTDTSGNIGNDQTFNELIVDNVAPVVTVDPLLSNTASPQLTGTVVDLDPGTTVSVNVGGNDYLATNNGDGTWTLPASAIMPDLNEGIHEVTVTATDTPGHIGTDASINELEIDTIAPVVTLDALTTPTDITSPGMTGNVTDADLTAAVVVFVDGNPFNATNNGDGSWTLPAGTITPALTEGIHVIGVTATDAAGNQGQTPSTVNLEIDTAPVVTVDSLTTSDQTPQLTGTVVDADTAAAVTVTVNGTAYPATNNGDGTWTLADNTVSPALADGTYDVSVSATDAGGNTGNDGTTNELTIDTTAPIVTVDALSTRDGTPALSGTVSDGESAISVTVNGITYNAVNNGNGTWTLPDNTITIVLPQGVYDVAVTATNLAVPAAVGSDATTNELTVDQTNPVVTFAGLSTGDPTPELTGTVSEVDTVSISVSFAGVVGSFTATNNGDGTWTLPDNTISPALAPGMYDVTVTAVDAAGNLGLVTELASLEILDVPFTITVDPLATTDTTPALTGTISDLAAQVVVTVNGIPHAAINNADGTWTLPDNTITVPLADGVYDVLASGTDSTPVTINDSTNGELTIDTTAPVVTVDLLSTTDTNPPLTGTVDDPTATISVTVNAIQYAATNNGDGTWTLANNTINPPLPVGAYDVQVTATDGLGNAGTDATIDELLVTTPTASTINLSDLLASNGGDGTAGVIFTGVAGGDLAGNSASGAGDINGDGFDDLVIGATGTDPVGNNDGSVYVVFGQAGGFPAEFDLSTLNGANGFRMDGVNLSDDLGVSVDSAGDVNGDGVDDLVIGADKSDPNGNSSGAAYVIYGKTTPFAATLDLTTLDGTNGYRFDGAAISDRTGFSVSGAGDLNGDGLDDVLIGTIRADDGVTLDSGRTYVIYGSTSVMPAVLDTGSLTGSTGFVVTGPNAGGHAGFSVSGAGDINGDGIADLRIGAPGTTVGANANAGKTFVVFGQAAGFPAELNLSTLNGTNGFVIEGDAADLELGFTGDAIGDFNGDGFGDLLIGAPQSNIAANPGKAYVVFGQAGAFSASITPADLDGSNGFTILGVDPGDLAGFNVAGVGDVNGDGFDDLLIGATNAAGGTFKNGEAYLLFGRAGVFTATLTLASIPGNGGLLINGIDVLDHAGRYVSGAGDVNGDGYADLIVTARDADVGGNNDAGETYLIFGRDFTGTVTQAGGATADVLTGSAGRDAIIAGAGDDELVGLGGPDVLSAGQGDDTLAISDTAFVRLTGGHGFDALRFDGAGILLDLTARSDLAVTGIEQIDVRGSGANSLTLDPREVLNLSDTTNTLLVLAESDDTVNIGAGWTASGSELINGMTFDVFTQGRATLKIFTAADTTAPVVTVDALTTTDTTPPLTGTVVDADPATTVSVTVNGIAYAATNNGDGTWTLADNTITPALAEGTYDVTVTATDTANNIGSDATINELVVDTPPVVTVDALTTTDTTPPLTGTVVDADPATTVSVTVNGIAYAATNNGDGTWTLADNTITPALAPGTYDVAVTAIDPGTNIGTDATINELVIELPLVGDLDGDGFVGITDLNIILGAWNQNVPPADPRADVDGNNFVGIADLNAVLGNWNAGTPPVAQATAASSGLTAEPVSGVSQAPVQAPVEASANPVVAKPVAQKRSLLDEVTPTRVNLTGTQPAPDPDRAAAAWGWMHDGSRGLKTAFGTDAQGGEANENALDLARPLPEQSAISRLL